MSEGSYLFHRDHFSAYAIGVFNSLFGRVARLCPRPSAAPHAGLMRSAATCSALLVCAAAPAQVIQASGTPPPIVFVHGNGDDSTRWIPTVWLFESNGYPGDRLFAIRFHHPVARTDNTREEPARSSTEDEKQELARFVQSVLEKTHAAKAVLVGSSRGGLTIRNYVGNGEGRKTVLAEILCGTPNHGVNATATNPNGEFNGAGTFLTALNLPGPDGNETTPGIPTLTLRSDTLDKYAQPSGIAFGHPEQMSGGSFESPALKGAENLVLPGLDHRELAFSDTAFAAMYRFLFGRDPRTRVITATNAPRISGLITGFAGQAPTNDGLGGVHLRVSASDAAAGSAPAYETTTEASGAWGPMRIRTGVGYTFALERDGRRVTYFLPPLPRSTTLLNFRFLPAQPPDGTGKPSLSITRPEGYFSRDRDLVRIDGAPVPEEPAGLPVRDSFTATGLKDTGAVKVELRGETILATPSTGAADQVSVVEFLR